MHSLDYGYPMNAIQSQLAGGTSCGVSGRSIGELVADLELLDQYMVNELIFDSLCKFASFTRIVKDPEHGVVRGGVLLDDPYYIFH